MFKKIFYHLKKIFRKKDKTNFYKNIKRIKKLIAKLNFDLAIRLLENLEKDEKDFLNENSLKENEIFYEKKGKIIDKLKNFAIYRRDRNRLKILVHNIKINFQDNNYKEIEDELKRLKENFIDTRKQFEKVIPFYNKSLKKLNKINKRANTKNVITFKDLVKKIEALISLGKFDLAEKGTLEIREKETGILEKYKNNHAIYRKKIKKLECEYNKKIIILDKLLHKIFIKKNRYLKKKNKEKLKKIYNGTKRELKTLFKTSDLYAQKDFIEKKLKENNEYVDLIGFLNKKLKLVLFKIKKRESKETKGLNTIEEVNKMLFDIGETTQDSLLNVDEKLKKKKKSLFQKFIFGRIGKIKELVISKSHKKTLEELNYLLGDDSFSKNPSDLEVIKRYHTGMTKQLSGTKFNGYSFYGKVIGVDKITGDTFVSHEKKDKYWFSIGDATGHGFKAGLIVSKFTKLFMDICNDFDKINYFAMELNNKLKGSLKSGNFLTCLLFEIAKEDLSSIKIIGMGHEPLFIYRKNKKIVEEHRFIGLAGGIRKISKIESIKVNNIKLNEGDIIVSYTDGIIEARNPDGEMYGLKRFKNKFLEASNSLNGNVKKVYDFLLDDLKNFSGRINYDDDVTIILFSRNSKTDIVSSNNLETIIKSLDFKVDLNAINIQKIKGKTKEELLEKLQKDRLKKELNIVIGKLRELYKDGEIVKLREEAVRYIKKGYISNKIKNYLKKAIDMEKKYKINIKNQKLIIKYKTLTSLYLKGDYKTVIKESYDIITKNGNL